MKTKDILDVTLITYNRASCLKDTLEAVFCEGSPIRDCEITVLNNKSTDDTQKVIDDFARRFSNLKCIVNNFNVGGNANIAKAIERYSKPYHWVICDDDRYDWSGWNDIQLAMERGEKIICVSDLNLPKDEPARSDPAQLIQQMTFLPSIIYGPGTISDDVMRNVYDNTFALFPHLAPVITFVNSGGKIYSAKKAVVIQGDFGRESTTHLQLPKSNPSVFFKGDTMTLCSGFANLTANIADHALSKRTFKAFAFGPAIGALTFYGEIFIRLRGWRGASCFVDVWNQSTFGMKCILLPLHIIQNSIFYRLLTNRTLYEFLRRIAARRCAAKQRVSI